MKIYAATKFLTLAILLCSTQLAAQENRSAPGVVVVAVRMQAFPLSAEALGNARANESVDIRPKISAALTSIHFEEGQEVVAGDVLVKLDNLEQVADLASARAALVESEASYQRSRELFQNNVVAESQLLQDEARKVAVEALVSVAEARVADTIVRAPFAGRIGLRRVSIGSLLSPATVITTLDDTKTIKLDFDLPEVFVSRLEPGLVVKARSAAWKGEEFVGLVTSIDTRVDPVSRTIRVRSVMPNDEGRLRPGMFLTVTLLNESIETLMIPEQALIPERSTQSVFVVADNLVAELRQVKIGRRRPGQVEVLEGLAAGEKVIVDGTQKARDGQPVKIIEELVIAQ
ncbi:MAG: efflux RND transporter periplasmic adaptor subunit [Xanthomonadales bacterium]|nr:efflux RND transporter periplasmic adaptor subunit [Xanthomonadales bacterium]